MLVDLITFQVMLFSHWAGRWTIHVSTQLLTLVL